MADDVTLPGTGDVIGADLISGVYYQRVKLSLGADGTAADAAVGAGTESGVLRVTLPTDGTGRALIGSTQVNLSQTPTVTNGAVQAGDACGGLLTFTGAARASGGTGLIQAVTILCKTPALLPALELWVWNQTFSATADNSAFAPSDADAANCIGVIPLAAWYDNANNSVASRFGLAFPFTCVGTANLYGQLVTRSTVTLTSTSDIIVGIQCLQD